MEPEFIDESLDLIHKEINSNLKETNIEKGYDSRAPTSITPQIFPPTNNQPTENSSNNYAQSPILDSQKVTLWNNFSHKINSIRHKIFGKKIGEMPSQEALGVELKRVQTQHPEFNVHLK